MFASVLLKSLEDAKKGKRIRLPATVRPDDEYLMDAQGEERFAQKLWNAIGDIKPPFIVVQDWDVINTIHYLEIESMLYKGLDRLFNLPASHIHFDFGDVSDSPNLVKKILHYVYIAYKDHIRHYTSCNVGRIPLLTCQINGSLSHPEAKVFTDKAALLGRYNATQLIAAQAMVYADTGDFDQAFDYFAHISKKSDLYHQARGDITRLIDDAYRRSKKYFKHQKIIEALNEINRGLRYCNKNTKYKFYLLRAQLYLRYYQQPCLVNMVAVYTRTQCELLQHAISDFETVLESMQNKTAKEGIRQCERLIDELTGNLTVVNDGLFATRQKKSKSHHQHQAEPVADVCLTAGDVDETPFDRPRV